MMSMFCRTTHQDNDNQLEQCHTVNDNNNTHIDSLVDKLTSIDLIPRVIQSSILEKEKEEDNSDSGHSEPQNVKTPPIRIHKSNSISGILKYPPGWKRRTFSESSALTLDLSGDFGYFEQLKGEDGDDEEDCQDTEDGGRPKKCVTFSSKNAIFVFRPNSSILGRRLKNQKKAKKRKERMIRDGLLASPGSDTNDSGPEYFNYDSCGSCDSFSSSSGCDSSGDESIAEETKTGEFKVVQVCESKQDTKGNRKNRRKRNRKSKQAMKTNLETGGYDSE